MFKFEDLISIHLEVSNNCQAGCPMCNRNIHGGLDNPLIKIKNWTLDEYKHIMNPEVLNQIKGFYFCGTFGDPLLNNDLIDMCEYTRDVNPDVQLQIHTNGSLRSIDWWKQLASVLPKKHRVVFALDGLSDTHHLYRIGTNYETIIRNATAFISAGGIAEWAFIQFKHNEHQTDLAKQEANRLGFKYFTVKNSSRFLIEPRAKVLDKQGDITHYIEPASFTPLKFIDKSVIQNYQKIVDNAKIECKVLKTKEIYVDAFGDLYACCWHANTPYTYIPEDEIFEVRHKILEQHKRMIEQLGEVNTLRRSIKDIINSDQYQQIWEDLWTKDKSIVCARACGNHAEIDISKNTDQFFEEIEFNE